MYYTSERYANSDMHEFEINCCDMHNDAYMYDDNCETVLIQAELNNYDGNVCTERDYTFPVRVNGIETSFLRDTGYFGHVIVDESLVAAKAVNWDKTISCIGAFDRGQSHRLPTAMITIGSPCFATNEIVTVEAAVTKLPNGINTIIGNRFFYDRPYLKDTIMAHIRSFARVGVS